MKTEEQAIEKTDHRKPWGVGHFIRGTFYSIANFKEHADAEMFAIQKNFRTGENGYSVQYRYIDPIDEINDSKPLSRWDNL